MKNETRSNITITSYLYDAYAMIACEAGCVCLSIYWNSSTTEFIFMKPDVSEFFLFSRYLIRGDVTLVSIYPDFQSRQ
jgi:hypothetical protein